MATEPTRTHAVGHAGSSSARSPWVVVLGSILLFLGLIAVLASIGGPHDFRLGISTVLYLVLRAGAPAAVYLLAGVGLGRVFVPLLRSVDPADRAALQAALGLGLLLSLSHALGAVGVFRGIAGRLIAGGVCLAGLVLLAHQIAAAMRSGAARLAVSPLYLLFLPPLALLLVTAANPPGWLWDSEAGGYDALSYHLQLPQEWLALGRLAPVQHNVYSYLPSYVEGAYLHLAVMTGEPASASRAGRVIGLVSGEGMGVISCQMLSVGIALIAAWMIARLVARACKHAGCDRGERPAAILAAAFVLSTPWTAVVGSLAYNDLAVVLFFAAAMLAAWEPGLAPARRGLFAGLLVGFACCCKPTALFMAGPPVALVLVAMLPRRAGVVSLLGAAAGGLVAIAPWLIRNWLHGGNPVFPMATSLFGSAHWSAEQVARYHAAHLVEGGVFHRLGLLLLPDAAASSTGTRMRGVLHPQFFLFAPACVLGGIALRWPSARRLALLMLGAIGMQLLAWLTLTHLQSRFLLPIMVPGAVLLGLGIAWGAGAMRRVHILIATATGILLCLLQSAAGTAIFAGQRSGQPNALLTEGPGMRTGELTRAYFAALPPTEQRDVLAASWPERFINYWASPDSRVYLLGDATPLYFRPPVVYNTTWDRWPLGEAMRAAPDDPRQWTKALVDQGVRLVLVNFAELGRLSRSGAATPGAPAAAKGSGWSDPAITPESVRNWLQNGGARPIKEWPEIGAALFELAPPESPR